MVLTPFDIARYSYCSYLYNAPDKAIGIFLPKLNEYEQSIRETIIRAEELCLLRDLELSSRKMMRVWDSIWWPLMAASGDMKDVKEKSSKASLVLSDYCKYDISGDQFRTVGVNLTSSKSIGGSTINGSIDIMKVDTSSSRVMVLVDLTRKGLSETDIVIDPMIRANAYCFYTGRKETIMYICVDPYSQSKKIVTQSAFFRPDDMENIRGSLILTECGIRKNIFSPNVWKCKECLLCNFKSLMRRDTH
jgi:hypothetical protein